MMKEIRYHIHGHFVEDRMPYVDEKDRLFEHFPVHHEIQKDVETFEELIETIGKFLSSYTTKYCTGLTFGISEEPSLVE